MKCEMSYEQSQKQLTQRPSNRITFKFLNVIDSPRKGGGYVPPTQQSQEDPLSSSVVSITNCNESESQDA